MQAIHRQPDAREKRQIYNLFAAYVHTVPLQELIANVERARRDAQLGCVVLYGAACSYCLGRAERLEGSYLRTFALALKERQTLAAFVTSILVTVQISRNALECSNKPVFVMKPYRMCALETRPLRLAALNGSTVGKSAWRCSSVGLRFTLTVKSILLIRGFTSICVGSITVPLNAKAIELPGVKTSERTWFQLFRNPFVPARHGVCVVQVIAIFSRRSFANPRSRRACVNPRPKLLSRIAKHGGH